MSERSRPEAADEAFAAELVSASKAERARDGAKARALAAVLPELSVATAHDSPHVMPSRTGLYGGVIGALLLAACVFLGVNVKHHDDVEAAASAIHAAELAMQQARTERLLAELRRQTAEVAALQAAVQNAKDDAARAAAMVALAEATQKAADTKASVNKVQSRAGAGAGAGAAKARAACNCTPGDPLCSCIP